MLLCYMLVVDSVFIATKPTANQLVGDIMLCAILTTTTK